MENSKTPFPSDFKVEEEAYSKVLQHNLEVSTDLPKWRTSSDVWGDWFRSMQELAKEIYEKYFKPDADLNTKFNWEIVFLVIKVLFWLSLATLIVYGILSLFRRFSDSDQVRVREPQISIETRENRLVDIIKEMMQKGEWAKAAKLRWRLFLERRNMNSEKTPLEFEREVNPDLPEAFEQYEQMFTEIKSNEDWYKKYSQKLRDLEGQK